MCETTTLSRDTIALLDNVQILIISKKLVNKPHSEGFITSLWLGITQWITNEISNFVTCSNNITYRTLHGRYQRKKCTLNFIKYTLSQPTALSTTKSTLLQRKECFIHSIKHSLRCNKAQLPTCSSAGY